MSRRFRVLYFGSAALLVIAGIAGAIAFTGTFGQVLALVLIGLGFVLAVGLVFLEVGLSEDREREREAQKRADAGRRLPEHGRRVRLERMRGSRRRLK